MNWIMKGLLWLVSIAIILVGVLLGYLTITEYRPADSQEVQITKLTTEASAKTNHNITIVSMNTGYGGLDKAQDFFLDGGKTGGASEKAIVDNNVKQMISSLHNLHADMYLLQEVDQNAWRSFSVNQSRHYHNALAGDSAFALNYQCEFVPIPLPPMGKVSSGVQTISSFSIQEATRESLPVPFSWPLRLANLKRCLLVTRIDVQDTDKELVVINLHLEAYDHGEGREVQLRELNHFMYTEYKKGNYVVAGGDFNANFPQAQWPVVEEGGWLPGQLYESDIPSGFSLVCDEKIPTGRSLKTPYNGNRNTTQFYGIDGFIVSDNIRVGAVETIDYNFSHSDHNPVQIQLTLLP